MNRTMKAMDVALMRLDPSLVAELVGRDPSEGQQLDGVPEWFIGPMLKDVIMHEVGHTLGLRHNFKASGIYDISEMHTEEMQGRPIAGSVMDYLPVNINMGDGEVQGPFGMSTLGPYDYWAIEYGYGFGDPEEVASRCADPLLAFAPTRTPSVRIPPPGVSTTARTRSTTPKARCGWCTPRGTAGADGRRRRGLGQGPEWIHDAPGTPRQCGVDREQLDRWIDPQPGSKG